MERPLRPLYESRGGGHRPEVTCVWGPPGGGREGVSVGGKSPCPQGWLVDFKSVSGRVVPYSEGKMSTLLTPRLFKFLNGFKVLVDHYLSRP